MKQKLSNMQYAVVFINDYKCSKVRGFYGSLSDALKRRNKLNKRVRVGLYEVVPVTSKGVDEMREFYNTHKYQTYLLYYLKDGKLHIPTLQEFMENLWYLM